MFRMPLVCILLVSAFAVHADEPKVQKIFDGKSLENFEFNEKHWRVEEGAIVGEIPAGQTLKNNEFIFWKNVVADFELTLQFKIEGDKSANSGIQFRSVRTKEGGAIGYQADLDLGDVWLGRIYDEHARALLTERGQRVSIAPDGRRWKDEFAPVGDFKKLAKPAEWQTYHLKAYGPHVEVWVNGKLFSVLDDHQTGEADYKGRLGFQLHSGPGPVKVQFKEIELKQIGETKFPGQAPTIDDPKNRQTQSPVLWHLRPNPAKPTPIENEAAQATVASMMVTEGFQVELIAAEPDLHQPIVFTFDDRGRIWVVEAHSYPNKQPEGQGKDKIRIFEDADGDGFFETKKTFTEGLNLVSGIELGFGGVWIGAAPQLLFIPDADKDDKPDGPPQVLLDGFGYQDTHETLNSFQWGPDGWLYGNQGVFNTASIGKPGAPESERTTLRAGVWRYHPTRHKFEIFAHGGSNQWGLAFNDLGHLFMTHCRSYWGGGGTTYVIQNGHFWNQTNSNYPDFISNSAPPGIPHLMNFLPASAKYDSGEGGAGKKGTDLVYGGHSHVGTMIYLGDNWPDIYRDHVFTHNLHGHQINHQHNVREGSGYETLHAGSDILYCPDPAYVPVDLKFGPDGAVYIIDWVDKQHCHNPRGETWDRTNGRIYRVSWKETYKPVKVDLGAKSDLELAQLQTNKNRWYGRMARRIMQERGAKKSIDSTAISLLKSKLEWNDDAVALASLWTLHCVGSPTVFVSDQLSEWVRAWEARLHADTFLSRNNRAQISSLNEINVLMREEESSQRIRLDIASQLTNCQVDRRLLMGEVLATSAEDANDRFLPKMIWFGLAEAAAKDPERALKLADETKMPSLADSIHWYLSRNEKGRSLILEKIFNAKEDAQAKHLLTLLHFGLQYDASLPMPKEWPAVVERFITTRSVSEGGSGQDPRVLQMLRELSALFGDEKVLAEMRTQLADAKASLETRQGALAVLKRVGDEKAMPIYLELLDEPRLRNEAIGLLAKSNDPQIAEKLLVSYNTFDDAGKVAALGVLTSRPAFAKALLDAIEAKTFAKDSLTALQITQIHFLGDAELQKQVEKIYGKVGATSEEAKAMIAKLKNTYTTAPLWAYSAQRGAATFKKHCATCHSMDGKAVPLGPSLAGSWRHGLNYFLDNIVDPNAVVGENFRTTLITTDSGVVHSGLLESESDTSVTLRTAEKQITVPKSEIEERKLIDQSIMPTGLLDKLSEEEIIELLKYLTERK
jgi:putative membrane-bound dehydrogenase-like protein